jgi:hypothetical protein
MCDPITESARGVRVDHTAFGVPALYRLAGLLHRFQIGTMSVADKLRSEYEPQLTLH